MEGPAVGDSLIKLKTRPSDGMSGPDHVIITREA